MEEITTAEVEEVEFTIDALFASDFEEKTVEIPGRPGYWVKLRQMSADHYAKYLQSSQSFHYTPDAEGAPQIDLKVYTADQELALLAGTITDFAFPLKKKTNEGEEITETMQPPAGRDRLQFMERVFRTITPKFRAWLLAECRQVNDLREVDLEGNVVAKDTITAEELTALFASDLSTEMVQVPGHPGSFIQLRGMDADAMAEYRQAGELYRIQDGKLERAIDVKMNVAGQQLILLTKTITNFCFYQQKRDKKGQPVLKEDGTPERVKVVPPGTHGKHRERAMADIFRELTPQFRGWLLAECERVNGLDGITRGN